MTTGNDRQEDIAAYKDLREQVMSMCRDKQYSKAVLPAEDLCAMCRDKFGESRSATVSTTIDLGMIYARLSDRARAELLFRQALEKAEGRWGTDDQKYLRSLKMLKQIAGEQALENQTGERLEELQKKVDQEALTVECPICGKTYDTTPKLASKEVFCHECDMEFPAGKEGQSPVEREAAKPVEGKSKLVRKGKVHAGSDYPYTFCMSESWVRKGRKQEKEWGGDVVVERDDSAILKIMITEWEGKSSDFNSASFEEACRDDVQNYRRIAMSETSVSGIPALCLEYEGVSPGKKRSA